MFLPRNERRVDIDGMQVNVFLENDAGEPKVAFSVWIEGVGDIEVAISFPDESLARNCFANATDQQIRMLIFNAVNIAQTELLKTGAQN